MSEKILLELLDSNDHHAFLIVGERQSRFEKFRHLLHEKIAAEKMHAADMWSREYETIGIDDARSIKEVQNTMPIGDRRVMLVSFRSMQGEAQNSLLKLFEDPSSHTVFFVCVDDTSSFLPTLLSRFYVVNPGASTDAHADASRVRETAQKFLHASYAARLNMLEPIITEKDKGLALGFIDSLEMELSQKMNRSAEGAHNRSQIFEELFSARHFLRSRSPSVKMILEHICGIVPVIH